MKLFTKIRNDTCPKCGRDRAIELYDRNNTPIGFSSILDNHRNIILGIREIHYGRCRYCKKTFELDWTDESRIPRPLVPIEKQILLQQYNKSKTC